MSTDIPDLFPLSMCVSGHEWLSLESTQQWPLEGLT
jgi:hypothetical protein